MTNPHRFRFLLAVVAAVALLATAVQVAHDALGDRLARVADHIRHAPTLSHEGQGDGQHGVSEGLW